jgi:hypothetical protein
MRQRIHSHLTYANVVATLSLFLVLGGGTALADYVISSNGQVGPDTISGHKPPTGDHANIIGGSVNGTDLASGSVGNGKLAGSAVTSGKVADNSLTGADIADRSGVDTCPSPLTIKLGAICAGSDAGQRTWAAAVEYCAGLGLRLPTITEGVTMAWNYLVPGVPGTKYFWTDDYFVSDVLRAARVSKEGSVGHAPTTDTNYTVCVTDPSA